MSSKKILMSFFVTAILLFQGGVISEVQPVQAAPGITAAEINAYLTSKNSPLAGYGATFISSGQTYGVDPRLIVAIAGAESSFGRANCQSWSSASIHNAWGYMYWPNGVRTCKPFSSWEEGIEVVSWQIGASPLYFRAGLTTIPAIGARYCGPSCANWFNNVTAFYTEMGGNLNDLTFATGGGIPNNDIVLEEPTTITPSYGPICSTAWYLLQTNRGHNAYLTLNTNKPNQSTNSGEWIPNLPIAGNYRVEAYVPNHPQINWSCPSLLIGWDTSDARYTVFHANGQTTVTNRNQQPLFNSWMEIGTFYFNAGSGGKVKLTDLNGETNLSRTIAFSAMKFIYVGTPVDATPPTGNITSPANQSQIGPNSIVFSANASDNSGGSGVREVNFWIRYNNPQIDSNGLPLAGGWYNAGHANSAPYAVNWTTPFGLRSQVMEFGIHVVDNAGNYCIDPSPLGNYTCYDDSSKRTVTFIESANNPNVSENWIPSNLRFYMNQLSLGNNADQKCFGASAAMVLAMRGTIGNDYETMRITANNIFTNTKTDLRASIVVHQINSLGLASTAQEYTNRNSGWTKIVQEISAGRPVIFLSAKMTKSGHYFVVVGYRQEDNNRELIVYDPYGRWLGTQGSFSSNSDRWDSYKGQWGYYNFDSVWGNNGWPWNREKTWMITIDPTSQPETANSNQPLTTSPNTSPDIVSNEPTLLTTYSGVNVGIETIYTLFLPTVRR